MVACVETYVLGQVPKVLFDLIQNGWNGRYIIGVGRFYMDVYDDVVLTVNGTMLTVMEALRLSFAGLLTAVWIGSAHHAHRSLTSARVTGALSWLNGFLPSTFRSESICAFSSSMYSSGVTGTVTRYFLCLLAFVLMCVESVYRTSPPTSLFFKHCRRILFNIFSSILLSLKRLTRLMLIVA